GRDARGRKQYRYHPAWRATRDEAKFDRVAAFGRALPRLRRRVDADLRRRGLPREKVLASVVALLEATLIRVGNDEYARANRSFGLTTLRKRHVRVSTGGAVFEFRGKSGKAHRTAFHDRRLARVIRACQDLRGQRLFKYVDEAGAVRAVQSGDVNDYIRAAIGDGFTAKDFRTWFGTLAAAQALTREPRPDDAAAVKAATVRAIRVVAGLLGNTPAVCRTAYVHPLVLEAFARGRPLPKASLQGRAFETALIRFLEAAGG
ncbi:MAG TPA: DNA topoisomerase IB, partial [Caulobacter sp.]|nr:DNA topoisomerase IB [Caulobacter sp.]